ncbi:hypothetical protein JAO76_14335 [Pontibacter sp. BT310]|uniref:60S ribosomal protein L38 n=1 Tax=Pontibacter populi TaxID=890055 RepID=A0ABS6XE26_9BACT|nr:hypothetical protein [Pontibacter sp. BT310]MBJ6119384.1 hypothetical protein [Pontibacter sp. BT310]MBR0571812.1 hypothetical protein [Microvirga sp. STS03]MBW3366238.1 hypothetical protein [Pontibacter populi]
MAQKYKSPVADLESETKKIKTIKVKVMRKNNKVARVSCYCKLNMLVPHLQRMQAERKQEKARSNNQ